MKIYYNLLEHEYAKNNSFSRIILYEQYKHNNYIYEGDTDFNKQFLNLMGINNFWKITSKYIDSEKLSPDDEDERKYFLSQLCESTINFLLNIVYKNSIDFMIRKRTWFVETVFFRPNESLKCNCIILLCSDHFKIFYDYYSYSEYFNNIEKTKVDYKIKNLIVLYSRIIEICKRYKHSFYDRPQIDIDIIYFKNLLNDEYYSKHLNTKFG